MSDAHANATGGVPPKSPLMKVCTTEWPKFVTEPVFEQSRDHRDSNTGYHARPATVRSERLLITADDMAAANQAVVEMKFLSIAVR